MRANGKQCPWCESTLGYRNLTTVEDLKHAPRAFAHALVSSFYYWRCPEIFLTALLNSTEDVRCLKCNKLVRICPNCDKVYRWVNGAMLTCTCDISFI